MKILFAVLMLASMSAAAVTITPLATPSGVPNLYPAKVVCIGVSFNADDSSNGTCYSQTASGGRKPTYTNLVYTANWDKYGNSLNTGTYCGKFVTNPPSLNVWTYAPGYNATSCYLPVPSQTQILLYDPTRGFDVQFGYESTSADGAYALLTLGLEGLIYAF